MQINLSQIPFIFDPLSNVISVSERDVKFATTYELLNPKTGNIKVVEFTHSTGPEFDPKTKYVYKSSDNIVLEVCNDKTITTQAGQNYLKAKTGR